MINFLKICAFGFAITIIVMIGACAFMIENINSQGSSNDSGTVDNAGNSDNSNKPKDKMADYMNEKYTDDKFTSVSSAGGGLGRRDKRAVLRSENYPDDEIMVLLTYVDGVELLCDNYLYFKYREQTKQKIDEILTKMLEHDHEFFYGMAPTLVTRSFPADTSFEDYVSDELSMIRFILVLGPGYDYSNRELFEEKFAKAFHENNFKVFSVIVCFTEEGDNYGELKDIGLDAYLGRHDKLYRLNIYKIGSHDEEFSWR